MFDWFNSDNEDEKAKVVTEPEDITGSNKRREKEEKLAK